MAIRCSAVCLSDCQIQWLELTVVKLQHKNANLLNIWLVHYITDYLLKSTSFWIKSSTFTIWMLVFLWTLFFSLFNNSANWNWLYTPHKGGWKSASVCWSRVSHEVYIVAATCSGLWLWLEEQAKIDWTCRCCACSIALCLLLFSCSVRPRWDKRRRRLQKGAILTDESGWP